MKEGAKSVAKKVVAASLLVGSVLILAVSIASTAAKKDFVAYWSAGQLLASHQNPYDPEKVLTLERSIGYTESRPNIMRNPPHALILAAPLGWLNVSDGAALWSLLIIASFVVSIRLLVSTYGEREKLHLLCYAFAPVLACLQAGQSSAIALVGLCGFLRFYESSPWIAGLFVALIATKPHLFIPLVVVGIFWVIANKQYKIVGGSVLGIVSMIAVPLYVCPSILPTYIQTLHSANSDAALMPTINSLVRLAVGNPYILPIIGLMWSLHYYRENRTAWSWRTNGLVVLMTSVLCAPYEWFNDEVVLLPAVLLGMYTREANGRSLVSLYVLNGIALVLVIFGVPMASFAYVWTPVAWCWWAYSSIKPLVSSQSYQCLESPECSPRD